MCRYILPLLCQQTPSHQCSRAGNFCHLRLVPNTKTYQASKDHPQGHNQVRDFGLKDQGQGLTSLHVVVEVVRTACTRHHNYKVSAVPKQTKISSIIDRIRQAQCLEKHPLLRYYTYRLKSLSALLL